MAILTTKNSRTMGIRFPLSLVEKIEDFAADGELTLSGAIRVLVERGLDSDIPIDELKAVSFNARAAAMRELDIRLTAALESFHEEAE